MIDLSSARIKRCDVRVKTEDFSYYLQDLGLEKVNSPDPDLRKEALEIEIEEVCEETSSTDLVEECSQQKEEEEEAEEACDDVESWYHGTTFTCSVCNYQSRILKHFEKHVEEEHACDLKQFSKKYKASGGKYACKICGSKVKHDKPDIDRHVQSHFLSLAKYGQLYEKKIIEITERKRLKKEEKAQVEQTASSTSDIAAPVNQAVETGNTERNVSKAENNTMVKSTENFSSQEEIVETSTELEIVENNNKSSEPASEDLADIGEKDPISFTIAEVNEVIHDMLSEEAKSLVPPPGPEPAVLESDLLKSPFPKSHGEIYIYCCPFPGCHYTCNFQASVIQLIDNQLIKSNLNNLYDIL